MAYRVADIFAGGGGFGRGFAEAGLRIVAAVDVDRDAVRTYTYNIRSIGIVMDVAELTHRDLERYGRIDVVIGGPPCEPFTPTNPNRMEDPLDRLYTDPMGQLTLHFIRIVGEVQPKVFVMENVPEIAREPIRSAIAREFKRIGFDEIHFNILRAEDYGTPSRRRRVFVSNIRIRPRPTTQRPTTVAEALQGLPPPDTGYPNHETVSVGSKVERIGRLRWGEALIKFRGAGGRLYENYIRLHPDQPAPTVMGSRRFIHPFEDRVLTVREQARLMGFPDDHVFLGPRDSQFNQVGEAVPPPLAGAIAREVARWLSSGLKGSPIATG